VARAAAVPAGMHPWPLWILRRRDLHSYGFHPVPDRKDCGAIPARRRYPERPERGVLCYRLRSICTWKDGPGQLDAQPGPTTAVGNAHLRGSESAVLDSYGKKPCAVAKNFEQKIPPARVFADGSFPIQKQVLG
jgi:hypothetical protein